MFHRLRVIMQSNRRIRKTRIKVYDSREEAIISMTLEDLALMGRWQGYDNDLLQLDRLYPRITMVILPPVKD